MATSSTYIDGPAADPHIVKALTEHLLKAYDNFLVNYPGKVDYIDGFMGAHNFHKAAVGHLVHETADPIWWSVAASTFERAIKDELGKWGGGGRPQSGNPQK